MTNNADRDVRHVKAARELLRWDQQRLADMAGLSLASVRRYEAARTPIAESIERGIIDALEAAGIIFVPEGEVSDATITGGVLIRSSAKPDAPAKQKVYVYGAKKPPGRPAGRTEKSARKPRGASKKPPEG